MRHKRKYRARCYVSLLFITCLPAFVSPLANGRDSNIRKPADQLLTAHLKREKIPVLSLFYPGLDTATAYRVQRLYVQQRLATGKKDKVAGFKAGLTSPAAMKRFGLEEPVSGVLPASGAVQPPAIVKGSIPNTLLMIETEIAFIAAKTINRPIKDIATLKPFFQYAAPAIELPNLGYTDMKQLKGPDIIASNIGADGFIVGQKQPLKGLNPDDISVTLEHNARTVNRGKGGDAMGNQWRALLWLVNRTIEHGWTIKPGHILFTGALGKMIPARPGSYIAGYGPFGSIAFEIR
jgi:2-keto-4-pentenoate hydratase